MFKVNISLVRFWENEFDILKPKKNGKGDRLFRPEDVKNLNLIYHLLREKKYTIDGAKAVSYTHLDVYKRQSSYNANKWYRLMLCVVRLYLCAPTVRFFLQVFNALHNFDRPQI